MRGLFLLLTFGLFAAATPGDPPSRPPVDYLKQIKPLLAKHCVACHGETRTRGGLMLDTAANALKGGKAGPALVVGNSDESNLIEAVRGDGTIERMPLKRPALSDDEIALLTRWIDEGAIALKDEAPTTLNQTHWAFAVPKRPEVPATNAGKGAPKPHPIDAFVRDRLAKAGLAPSPEADRITLIRRVTLDLIGLPPTIEEVEAFVKDDRPDAYERVVDRLLASPHFGERWSRLWLDGARYADSNGYSIDAPRSIWKYRDWVIDAFNRDQPFDDFVIDQLAGDLKPNATLVQKTATGFHRNTQINQEGGIDQEQFRVDSIYDRVATTTTVFLGLTVGCAQCHDHKYDPITQREYYNLFAFFNSVDEPTIEFATPADFANRETVRQEIVETHKQLNHDHPEIALKMKDWEANLSPAFKVDQPPETKDAFDRAPEKRTENQARRLTELFLAATPEYKADHEALVALRKREPNFETTMVVSELKEPRVTQLHIGGDFTRKGEVVGPDGPAVLPPIASREPNKRDRLDLARWLVDSANPLTARVTVNRLWQAYFGQGIVETENDFGTQGTPPSHPELLDWLATELIQRNWSLKAIHKEIVLSQTYKQASKSRAELDKADPENLLLGRQSRSRLDAELIRDSALAVSGLLASKIGGPSVYPPQPSGVMDQGQMRRAWQPSTGEDRYRRGLYTFFWRATPFPALMAFDAPNAIQSCTRRNRSNTPIQALTLLNDASFLECATTLAHRVEREGGPTDADKLRRLFQLAISRDPSAAEEATLVSLLQAERNDPEAPPLDRETNAWLAASRVILNTDEFITRE